jgi:hypothetical protein
MSAFAEKIFNFALVDQVYSGRTGCMCGCLGNYRKHEDAMKSVKIMTGKMRKLYDELGGKFTTDGNACAVENYEQVMIMEPAGAYVYWEERRPGMNWSTRDGVCKAIYFKEAARPLIAKAIAEEVRLRELAVSVKQKVEDDMWAESAAKFI